MRIAIVGWGLEGQSVYRFFGNKHDYLIVNEHQRDDFPLQSEKVKLQYLPQDKPTGMTGTVEDLSYLEGIDSCDKIIYSVVAFKNLQKVYGNDKSFWDKATTIQHIFFASCPSPNIIGVTGTKGKGTTSTLIAKLLEAEGKSVHFGGNIGLPVLDLLPKIKPTDWVVLELTNFQLFNLPYSPHIAICLMIAPEHLDWHSDMDEYVMAKANIFRHQKPNDLAIYLATDDKSKELANLSPGKKIPYYSGPGAYVRDDGMIVIGDNGAEVIRKSEVKLLGEHNLQNICAALTTVYQAVGGIDPFDKLRVNPEPAKWIDKAKAVLSSFNGLEHRLELVRSLRGINYYDDSFGTTPDTAIVAIRALPQPKAIILGGSDKGASFDELAKVIKETEVRHAILIGKTAPKIEQALKRQQFTDYSIGPDKMPAIVALARKHAKEGDAVLLSTACASFGLFSDYKDRGNQFKAAVNSLK